MAQRSRGNDKNLGVTCRPKLLINLRFSVIEQFQAMYESAAEDRRMTDAESNV
jgi:hypothetical protein